MPEHKKTQQNGTNSFISAGNDVDVEEIMNSIKKRIQEKKDSGVLKQIEIEEIDDMELLPLPDFLEIPDVYQPNLYPDYEKQTVEEFDENAGADSDSHINYKRKSIDKFEVHPDTPEFEAETGSGVRGIIKKSLLFCRKLVFPLVRFMTRPIYNELKQLTYDRHNELKQFTCDRDNELKHLACHWHNENIENLDRITPQIFRNTNHILKTTTDFNNYKPMIHQGKEYIKLLHNLINNMVAESSKLKIESELLKTKMKVMEDKIEFLENRERAIENKLFEDPEAFGVTDESAESPKKTDSAKSPKSPKAPKAPKTKKTASKKPAAKKKSADKEPA
ncbi:MAG: hypothetical protein GY757_17525 [bacterium]|nr:hypothetical protein [bacterium]